MTVLTFRYKYLDSGERETSYEIDDQTYIDCVISIKHRRWLKPKIKITHLMMHDVNLVGRHLK